MFNTVILKIARKLFQLMIFLTLLKSINIDKYFILIIYRY